MHFYILQDVYWAFLLAKGGVVHWWFIILKGTKSDKGGGGEETLEIVSLGWVEIYVYEADTSTEINLYIIHASIHTANGIFYDGRNISNLFKFEDVGGGGGG